MIIKNERAVNMTLSDILSLWIPLRQPATEQPNATSHMSTGGDQDDNPHLLGVTNGKTI